ncbi:Do family serine endopeptidase [Asticcacaulis sp. EMRT-3]|uniref:Do family serine endopeptidase n=1 Tax=Asticcacaulis sp. EMRT-3 TaxID=3040349 RepID=UPI0024AF3EA8|nr:Do family serine endopeptidase [Asticcacaulis sp. EMRT-3]MDI7775365.1 Do family serine endopeptidase [Asticcacaulis sp. EMRT-3]
MGTWNFKTMLKNKSVLAGGVVGLALGASVAGAAISGLGGAHVGKFDGASLMKTADLTPITPPAGAPMSFADLIERVSPAVVSIETTGKMKVDTGLPNLPGFSFPGQGDGQPQEQEVHGAGSGFFISPDGYVVTNNHVIDGADDITVKLTNNKELKATVVGRDVATDLAVLKVQGTDFPFVRFELDHKPRVGDWVIAMGNPFNFSNTATAGIVSAYGRDLAEGGADYVDYLQIDAAINRGNSGGPTFDMYGRVIGINTAIVTPSGGNAGVGFAIPADVAAKITSQLMKGITIQRGYVGIAIAPVTQDNADALGIKDLDGAYVTQVNKGGPADKAGMQIGDIVRTVNGVTVKSPTDLTRRIADVKVGEKVNIGVMRNNQMVNLSVTAALRPSEDVLNNPNAPDDSSAPGAVSSSAPVIGLSVKPITPDARRAYGLDASVSGLLITDVDDSSDAGQKGLKPGDIIVRANNQPVATQADFAKIVADMKKAGRPAILLLISRGGQNVPVPLSLKPDAGAKK